MTREKAKAILKGFMENPLYSDIPKVCRAFDMAIKALEQTRWIPCSEKMPDINIHVLAQFVMGGMAECYYAHNWWHIVGGFRISGDEVIAWTPLPQPYKAEKH